MSGRSRVERQPRGAPGTGERGEPVSGCLCLIISFLYFLGTEERRKEMWLCEGGDREERNVTLTHRRREPAQIREQRRGLRGCWAKPSNKRKNRSTSQSGGSKENYFLWEWIAIYGLRRDQENHSHTHTSLVLRWTYLDIGLCSAIVSWITLWTAHLDGSVWCICPHGVRAFLPCPLFCKFSASMWHLQIEQRTEKWEVKCATHTTDLPHSFN